MTLAPLRLGILGLIATVTAGCGGSGSGTIGGGGGGGGGNNATTVTFTFDGPTAPVVVAAKIGTGAFTAQTPSGSTLALSVPSGTSNYAVAYLCPVVSSEQYEYVWEASAADGTSLNFSCPFVPNSTGTLTGTLDASAISGVEEFSIESQNGDNLYQSLEGGAEPLSFDAQEVAGNDRILVLAYPAGYPFSGPLAAKNFSNQTVPGALNGGNTVVFSAADETTLQPIIYDNVPAGFSCPVGGPITGVSLELGGQAEDAVVLAAEATTQYPELPASATDAGDVYVFDAAALWGEPGNCTQYVETATASSGGPLTFTFPTPWTYAGPTPAALPSFTFDYTGFSGSANISQQCTLDWPDASGAGSTIFLQVQATANYQGGSTTLAVPDLSGVAGFSAPPATGTQVGWEAIESTASFGFGTPIPLNGTSSAVGNRGYYTVP